MSARARYGTRWRRRHMMSVSRESKIERRSQSSRSPFVPACYVTQFAFQNEGRTVSLKAAWPTLQAAPPMPNAAPPTPRAITSTRRRCHPHMLDSADVPLRLAFRSTIMLRTLNQSYTTTDITKRHSLLANRTSECSC